MSQLEANIIVDGEGCYRMEGCLDFETVPQLLQQSKTLFGNEGTITVDLAGVTRSNSAGLALLLEWMRWARQQARQIHFSQIPDAMLSIAEASDLQELLP